MDIKKIIVFRFSAMGDVAMVASILKEFSVQHPSTEIVIVSRQAFEPFFNSIQNLVFHTIDPKKNHKGLAGLFKLYRELKSYHPDAVVDLHDNIRSRIVAGFLSISGVKARRIDKGRKEKKALTRKENKIFKPLKLTVERYADVFRSLNFDFKLSHSLIKSPKKTPKNVGFLFAEKAITRIGISPFAQHSPKMYSFEKMAQVIDGLTNLNFQVFIFGGSKQEQEIANKWETTQGNVHNFIGKFSLEEELAIISNLDLMLSMDSSGMHLASLMGIEVVSLWGGTHPYAGFLGYGQLEKDCLQVEYANRPTSIYGNKPCLIGVENCIDLIDPEEVINKIKEKLNA